MSAAVLCGVLLAAAGATQVATLRAAHAQVEDDLREGDTFFEEGNFRRAAAAYDNAIRKYPQQVPAGAYGKRAAIYIIQKDYQHGLLFVNQIAKKAHPEAPEILEQEALMRWQLGDKPEAIDLAERVVVRNPRSFLAQGLIGEYSASRDPRRTITAYEAYLDARPAELEGNDVLPRVHLGFAYLARARQSLQDGNDADATADYERAASQLELVERKFGKRANAAVNADNGLCAAYTGLGRFDRAIAVCERVTADPRKVDATGSVWFNLGVAYLNKRQPAKARAAAGEFLKLRKTEARGTILIGDAYFQEQDWPAALEAYLKAESQLKAAQQGEQVDLSIKLGKTYRRLPAPASGPNTNLVLAIEKLEHGAAANPSSLELAGELGSAYLANRQDAKALTVADRLIGSKEFATASDEHRTTLLSIAGKASYNQGKLAAARERFEAAVAIRPKDVALRRALVETINGQAWAAFDGGDTRAAQTLLEEAQAVDPDAPSTSLNLAVLAIERGDCDGAQHQLARLSGQRGYTLVYERLLARTYLCAKKPDLAQAAAHYALADKEAQKNQANLLSAEIYTEWAPLIAPTDLDDAVEKLLAAVQLSAQSTEVGPAARRNLALLLFRRGWRLLKTGRSADAEADFDRALREPQLLEGTEEAAFNFSHALALLDKGDTAGAGKIFKMLAGQGGASAYLAPQYAKVGTAFFEAYADYRSQNGLARQKAAAEFVGLQRDATGPFALKVRDLIASSFELVAYDYWKAGKAAQADKALTQAYAYADDEIRRRLTLDRAVMKLSKDQLATLEAMGNTPPEALVSLGILYEQLGRPKDAYDAWQRARAKGVAAKDLQKWIDAKKRIYGY
ncbi:MAG TPA: tetratricopeptide repeat protein [Kofleriaceae bacterium]|nr:tetratricopeptide repeat protein [Kofleriaceae bacterium]